jgi:hypothetical protein
MEGNILFAKRLGTNNFDLIFNKKYIAAQGITGKLGQLIITLNPEHFRQSIKMIP